MATCNSGPAFNLVESAVGSSACVSCGLGVSEPEIELKPFFTLSEKLLQVLCS